MATVSATGTPEVSEFLADIVKAYLRKASLNLIDRYVDTVTAIPTTVKTVA